MPAVLTASVLIAGYGFWQGSQHHPDDAGMLSSAAAAGATAPARPAPSAAAVALTHDSAEALRADNAELASRIAELEHQQADADHLIRLKTARLQALEKAGSGK